MAGPAARPMNIHSKASTPHRHSSGKDTAWLKWQFIALHAKAQLVANGNGDFMITKEKCA
jgi:hypothetical protein